VRTPTWATVPKIVFMLVIAGATLWLCMTGGEPLFRWLS